MRSHVRSSIIAFATVVVSSACATTQFDRDLKAHRWSDAASAFDADSSLHNDEHALFRAAMLHSVPHTETYDPTLARTLFERLLRLYPSTAMRQTAVSHLSLLGEIQQLSGDAALRAESARSKITQLMDEISRLHMSIDSLTRRVQREDDQNDLLRKVASRLDSDLREREDQLRELRAELAKLKEIDLKPSRQPSGGDTVAGAKRRS